MNGTPDIEVDLDTIKDEDRITISSCSNCSSLGSVNDVATSYNAFAVPPAISTGTGVTAKMMKPTMMIRTTNRQARALRVPTRHPVLAKVRQTKNGVLVLNLDSFW